MQTAAEILAAINALPDDERARFSTDFQNDQGAGVIAARSKAFAAGKKEGGKDATKATGDLATAQERIAELEADLAVANDKKSADVKANEDRLNTSWQKKLDAEKARADAATTTLRTKQRELTLAQFTAALTAKQDDGTQVDPEWVKDVAESRWGSRIAVKDDGTISVLQLGGDGEYDAPTTDAAVALLAADARRAVPARYVLANADSGAGITNGGYGGSGVPAAKVEAQRMEQARTAVSGAF